MKKYLLTWALITITVTTLYATTAGSAVVDKMKAAVHAFTLSTQLNPTDTGLTSEPVKGKKTGDILTAGEYNRILELVSEGGTGGSSTGFAFYKCTNAQSLDTTNAPCYGASRNGGAGTNQYRVVSCSNTDASGTYTAGGLLNFGDFITNKWSFHINNTNIACTDGTILVMDIQGGGSGSTSATCPTGFVAVGSFCIEPTMNATNKDWYEAALACTEKGAQLCHWSEWSAACQKGVLTDVVFGASGKYEWIDDYSIANQGIADPIVYSNCKYLSRQADGTKAANTAYRCCAPKQ